jgi:hypothetical protein
LPDAGKSCTLAVGRGGKPLQPNDYERLRRDLETQLAADLDLIRAAHEAKLRALEALRDASANEEPRPESPPNVTQTEPIETPSEAPRRRRGDLLADILEVFPNLPETFDKTDIVRLLGYEPNRPSLHRVWDKLQADKRIAIERFSTGRRPTRFRKVGVG